MRGAALAFALLAGAAPASAAQVDGNTKQRLVEAYARAFGDECATDRQEFLEATRYYAFEDKGSGDADAVLAIFLCSRGAYHELHAVLLASGRWVTPIAFAQPVLDIRKRPGGAFGTDVLESLSVRGFAAARTVLNADFDPETTTLSEGGRWRGIGDASSYSEHGYEKGRFVLRRHIADPTYNGEVDPLVVIEDGRAIEPRPVDGAK